MGFTKEQDFEDALVEELQKHGWTGVLKYPTERDLRENWKGILFDLNREPEKLNERPLTDGEMRQVLEAVGKNKTVAALNSFILGGSVTITRDHPDEIGKTVALKIFNPSEKGGGSTKYQIVRQPKFETPNPQASDRRGDLMLLINGIPVIHIELKRSGVDISKAIDQIKHYRDVGVFRGIFSLVQVFVAMNPEETKYFANPGAGVFNVDYQFHWADFNNIEISNWQDVTKEFLSIPRAHDLIANFTIADDTDGSLKVLRSYQIHAVNAIVGVVQQKKWNEYSGYQDQLGGFIWHTTGSGKTMTSFKAASLIANAKLADKVVFMVDRIDLGNQSLLEYRNFAGAGLSEEQKNKTVQGTEDSQVLAKKLTSVDPADRLIVTSIQKMSVLAKDEGLKAAQLEVIRSKRIVFIVDEAHRTTFGDMFSDIKHEFTRTLFFGFTGTPIFEENSKKDATTAYIFGNELHRYSIADGLNDGNVLGFDPNRVATFKDADIREWVALRKANASSLEEAYADPKKTKVLLKYLNDVPMAGYTEVDGSYVDGIEDFFPFEQYRTPTHRQMVVSNILESWMKLSQCGRFHAIFATSSIPEAVEYYRLFKEAKPDLKVVAIFDTNSHFDDAQAGEDAGEDRKIKDEDLLEIIDDYNKRYHTSYNQATFPKMKKDIALRLAHKGGHKFIDQAPEKQIDLLIVVEQMLTGFDSKWINTLYLDKVIRYEKIIQAFSRTNRLFGSHVKPFGVIKYYRKPHTMQRNIEQAIALYSGDKEFQLFVPKLDKQLKKMNAVFSEIVELYENSGIENMERLPDSPEEIGQFAALFSKFNQALDAAKIQGFSWDQSEYEIKDPETGEVTETVTVDCCEEQFNLLAQRYSEIPKKMDSLSDDEGGCSFPIDGYLTEIATGKINKDYMNAQFTKFCKVLHDAEELRKARDIMHKEFAKLPQEEQVWAKVFLNDVESGNVVPDPNKTCTEYIAEYLCNAQKDKVNELATSLGVCEETLRNMKDQRLTEKNINENGKFEKLMKTLNLEQAKKFLEEKKGKTLKGYEVKIAVGNILRNFILSDGYDYEI